MVRVTTAAIALGAAFGLGVWSLLSVLPSWRRPRAIHRVAPYVLDVSPAAHAIVHRDRSDPLPVLGDLVGPWLESAARAVGAVLGDDAQVARRIRRAGLDLAVRRFRMHQVTAAVGAALMATVAVLLAPGLATLPPVARIVLPLVAAAAGALGPEQVLQWRARRRMRRLASELPTVLEFLTLSITAGESMLDALTRVSRLGAGVLPGEFAGVVASVHTGVPLARALRDLGVALGDPALDRCIAQIVAAIERGAPTVEVLRALAGDVRGEASRALIELAGRKEIAMLVPLVFLILPVTVAFAVYPGLMVLQAGF
ncbi:type II secretion system F family protein [Agromyces sp. SYSU T00194]|uniref:type II secretion system F family protein n=1 Tax=Agromyces chitinivorans TaxID=3158560 RepID=UPI003398A27D